MSRSPLGLLCLLAALLVSCAPAAPAQQTAAPAKPTEASKPAAASPGAAAAAASPSPAAGVAASPSPGPLVSPSPSPAAQAAPAVAASNAPAATVELGSIGLVADAGIFIAQERGYFAEQNLTVNIQTFAGIPEMVPLLATGRLDVGAGGLAAGIFNGIARDLQIVMTADKGSQPPGNGANSLVVRQDLLDGGEVKTAADLKGRQVGADVAGTVNRYFYGKIMEREGLSIGDLELVELTFPDMIGALLNKRIDAALAPEPIPTIMESRGAGRRFITTDQVAPNSQPGVVFFSRQFAQDRAEVGKRWMVAYLKGVRDYNRALTQGGQVRADVVQILTQYTSLKDPAVYEQMVWFGLNPDGTLFRDNILDVQDWLVNSGDVQRAVPWERLADTQFIEHAVQQLGPYRP